MAESKPTLLISPRLGSFSGQGPGSDTFCIVISFQGVSKTSSPGTKKASIYEWSEIVDYQYEPETFQANKDIFILFEVRQYIMAGSHRFIGRNVFNVSKIYDKGEHVATIDLFDGTSTRIGYIEVQFEFKRVEKKPDFENPVLKEMEERAKNVQAAFVFTPLVLKIDQQSEFFGKVTPVISFYHAEQAFKTDVPAFDGRIYRYNDIITMNWMKNETVLKVFVSNGTGSSKVDLGRNELDLNNFVGKFEPDTKHSMIIKDGIKFIGTLFYQLDIVKDVLPAPGKAFQPVYLKYKEKKGVKINYYNKTNKMKNLFVISDVENGVVQVLTPELTIQSGETGEIKFSVENMTNFESANCRIDVWNKERNEVEECLVIRLRRNDELGMLNG